MSIWLGFSLSFSAAGSSPFVGGLDLAGNIRDDQYTFFFYQFSFAATTGTIVSGSVAGRMRFLAYVALSSVCVSNLVYPVAVHWAWSDLGWLKQLGFEVRQRAAEPQTTR